MNLSDPPLREPALQDLRDSHLRLLSIHRSFQDLYTSSVAKDPIRIQRYNQKLPELLQLAQRRLDEENEPENEPESNTIEQDEPPEPPQRTLRKRPAANQANSRAKKASKAEQVRCKPKRGKSSSYVLDIPQRTSTVQKKKEMHVVYRRWRRYTPWRGRLTSDRLAMWCSLARVNGVWRGSGGRRSFLWRNLSGG